MHEDEVRRQIAGLVADNTDRATPPPVAAIRRRGRRRRARLASGAVLLIAAVAAGLVAAQGPLRRQVTPVPVVTQPVPGPRPHQWVYTKELRVEYGGGKPFTIEHWKRVDGEKFVYAASSRRVTGPPKVRRERMQYRSVRGPRCPGMPEPIPPRSASGPSSRTRLRCPPTPTGCLPPSTSWSRTPPAPPSSSATPSRTGHSC
jgi:hypothetical protein